MNSRRVLWQPVVIGFVAAAALADESSFRPDNGQTLSQRHQDAEACHAKAIAETGFDPAKPGAPPATRVGRPKERNDELLAWQQRQTELRQANDRAFASCVQDRGYSPY